MKKIILAIALFAAVGANAQSDGFFTSRYSYDENREGYNSNGDWEVFDMPGIIGHGYEYDQSAPLGSGLLVLAGLGVAYGIRRRNK